MKVRFGKLLLLQLLTLVVNVAESGSLSSYEVVSVRSANDEQFQLAGKIVNRFDLDIWTSRRSEGEMEIMIRKDQHHLFKGFNISLVHPDIQKVLDQSSIVEYDAETQYPSGEDPFYNDYRSYSDTLARMNALCAHHSEICATFVLGQTVEGKNIDGVHIGGAGTGKELVFIGNIHAREWVAPATVLYILEQLLVLYDSNNEVKRLVDSLKFTIIPVLNVDGRIYTETTQRMWRKNRRRNSGNSYGIDLNRNFDYRWGGGGSSGDPSSDIYRGPSALSEPEAAALRKYVCENKPEVFIDYHTSGNMFMSSWGYTSDLPTDYEEMMAFGAAGTKAIEATHNTKWKLGSVFNVIYQSSGSTGDTTYGSCGVAKSYCLELRGPGFSPPASAIRLSCEENWNGVLAMGKYLLDNK